VSRAESIIVGSFLGLACPLSFFVLGWWTSASLAVSQVLPISERGIAALAITGLCVGILLDVFFLRKWTAKFYGFGLKLIAPIYLFWSAVAVASLMGLPFSNLVLGTLAGLYVGRRAYHAGTNEEKFRIMAKSASVLTGLVTSGEEAVIGVLVLRDPSVVDSIGTVTGLDESIIAGPVGIGLALIACVMLFIVQFWCTRIAARFAFNVNGVTVRG
jgi:hypothetical protein